MKILGKIKPSLYEWVQTLRFEPTPGNLTTNRSEIWFINKFHYGSGRVTPASKFPPIVNLKNLLYPEANSCLVLKYLDGGIFKHRDHRIVADKLVQINLGRSCQLILDDIPYDIEHRDIVEFNCHKFHSVPSVSGVRYVVSFRRILNI